MKLLFLILIAFNLSACSSYFKRQECESINWFEHGKKVAMSGKYLNADSTLNECRKVDAEMSESQLDKGFKSGVAAYCSNSNAYSTGRAGDFFPREICEGPQINVLVAEHNRGIRDYCMKSNGFQAGTSGKKYLNICPKELEPAFLPEYRRGRLKYVKALIIVKEGEVTQLENKMSNIKSSLNYEKGKLDGLERQKNYLESTRPLMADEKSLQRQLLEKQISNLDSDVSTLRSKVQSTESDVSNMEKERNEKLHDITALKTEIPSLED
ncbi:DUF2799 domain-containing protein [Bdellovibrio reynosensis]|uniref:DUF2799 domain-containing protein n=1 Tax=Bdellovibrio reynosensis TaxID=2835041 RepID=A0ABY4C7M0_9BACT|nr:DUF2799 domain-containing protein [Bdellovibrio reynosensis]UOF00714.1 DUF2799 domain-containing protein [Bdellovibrio reynosensis]